MIEQIWNLIENDVFNIITTLVSFVTVCIATKVKYIYEQKVTDERKRTIVKTVVNAIEQVYKEMSGEKKLAIAQENVLAICNEKKLSITDLEMNLLIEETCHSFK